MNHLTDSITTVAMTTPHFRYILAKDGKGRGYYQVWEREGNNDKPIAMYDGDRILHLREDFPVPENKYKYFDEMCDIITDIHKMKMNGEF